MSRQNNSDAICDVIYSEFDGKTLFINSCVAYQCKGAIQYVRI